MFLLCNYFQEWMTQTYFPHFCIDIYIRSWYFLVFELRKINNRSFFARLTTYTDNSTSKHKHFISLWHCVYIFIAHYCAKGALKQWHNPFGVSIAKNLCQKNKVKADTRVENKQNWSHARTLILEHKNWTVSPMFPPKR